MRGSMGATERSPEGSSVVINVGVSHIPKTINIKPFNT